MGRYPVGEGPATSGSRNRVMLDHGVFVLLEAWQRVTDPGSGRTAGRGLDRLSHGYPVEAGQHDPFGLLSESTSDSQ